MLYSLRHLAVCLASNLQKNIIFVLQLGHTDIIAVKFSFMVINQKQIVMNCVVYSEHGIRGEGLACFWLIFPK